MAMLAERRQRKRYNLVPRGKALYEDDSRYGTKMLEKMGWSKGKGLGANENGSMDFVRVRYKNDANGLGYEDRDDQWTQHEESFSGLLKSLNGNEESTNGNIHEENDADDSEVQTIGFGFKSEPKKSKKEKLKEKFSGESLEEKSKSSKARVHYKKFTRGKDLALYSEKDLANIFGKKASEENVNGVYEQFTAIQVEQNENSEDKEEKEPTITKLAGVETINIGLSVQDYFKQKMEEMKRRKLNGNKEVVEQNTSSKADLLNDSDEPKNKRKKKNASEEAPTNVLYGYSKSTSTGDNLNDNDEPKKINKKKKKEKDVAVTVMSEVSEEAPTNENLKSTSTTIDNLEDRDGPKLKRKKKNTENVISETVSKEEPSTNGLNGMQESTISNADNMHDSEEPKKKKKKKNSEKDVPEKDLEEIFKEAQKKMKKSINEESAVDVNGKQNFKKSKVVNDENSFKTEELSTEIDRENGLVKSKKSKKKKQVTNVETDIVAEVNAESVANAKEISTGLDVDVELVKCRKSKKKDKTSNETVIVAENKVEGVNEISEEVNAKNPFENKCNGEEKREKKKKQKIVDQEVPVKIALEVTQEKTNIEINPEKSEVDPLIIKNNKKNKSTTISGEEKVDTTIAQRCLQKSEDVSACTVNSESNSPQNELTLDELIAKSNSYNVYSTSSFCAEKFGNANLSRFIGSNIQQILGYGLSEDIKLDIKVNRKDQERITNLWKCTLNKYKNAPPKNIYKDYRAQALEARKRRQRIPRLKVKSFKRKNAFSVL